MKALCWHGKKNVQVDNVPDPKILNERDIVLRITATAICGSDLHLYNGLIPSMKPGDILGHEFMGEVVEVGKGVHNVKAGERVVVPFNIACGGCFFCNRNLTSLCDNSNPNAGMAEAMYGYSASGLFGYSHLFGGYAGGQAEMVRVPFGDIGPFKVPDGIPDEAVLFLTDIFPTGYMAAENCNIQPGDTIAVWGCGPVGLFAIKSAYLLGAERVIAIDHVPERLALAQNECGAEILDYKDGNIGEKLKQMTGGLGPDACIDAVGLEAHGNSLDNLIDKGMHAMRLITDRPHVFREAILSCRKGGTVSLPGVYGGFVNQVPLGAAHSKGLTLKMGQTHVHKYLPTLMDHVQNGRIDTTFLISHRLPLSDAAHGYDAFSRKVDGATKIVLLP